MAGDTTVNGTNAQDGSAKKDSKPNHKPHPDDTPGNVKRENVESTFGKYSQVIHAARRPLPTRSGDGEYVDGKKKKTGLGKDLRTMGFKGVHTVGALVKSKLSGELVDDRTYMMEKVIGVCVTLVFKLFVPSVRPPQLTDGLK